MSLVVTSSSQTEYDSKSQGKGGIENPSSFKNFLNSPLTLDANTEVAVVSVKCNRDRNTITIQRNEGFYLYWGEAEPDNEAPGREDINTALQLVIPEGTYTPEGLAAEVKRVIDVVVLKAYGEVASTVVSANYTSGELTGYSLQFTQRGDGSSLTDKPLAPSWGAYIDAETLESYQAPSKTVSGESRNFTATNSITNVIIKGYNASFPTERCDCIGKSNPLSQVDSTAIFLFNGSSVKDGDPDGYTIGLTRSLGSVIKTGNKTDYVSPVHQDVPTADDINVPDGYGFTEAGDVPFLWDVAFNWKPGSDGQVVQLTVDADEFDMEMKTITTLFTPSNASLQEKIWDAVVFEMSGEFMTVSLRLKTGGALQKLVDGATTTFGSRVKPFGITCNQLYPKVAIHQNNASTPGQVTLTTWNGIAGTRYYDENYWGYGRAEESIYLPDTTYLQLYNEIDSCSIYIDGTTKAGTYSYKPVLGSNLGISNSWTLLMGDSLMFSNNQEALLFDNLDRFRDILGVERDETHEDQATGAGTAIVTFTSTDPKSTEPTKSMFIRLKNMSINSYNANMRSISNIIYACPRFDTTGQLTGNLFFEPAERVYVSLNNPNKTVLNSLEIDFVGVNEEVLSDYVGNTVVVLHFRKKK